ncbi:phage tail tape measure protein [Eikenella corrodens]|uniref:phage tail tape measure protein n=1 Tax=Eikenella corrodens TaxID=539 RepID=UPI001F033085|nr:phage tail tape measure protein [Eikenella corrodens]
MSSNTLELVAKFKDNASQGLRRLLTESQRAATGQARVWAQAGRQRQQAISAYHRLGIRSEQQIRREMQLTQAAYNRLARSGTLSQRELARAAEANRRNLQRLNNELRSGAGAAGSWRQRLGGAMTTVAAAGVGAYTVLKPSMDNQKQLEANISQVAWQAFGEDNSKTSDWIATTGKQQIRDLVTELVAKNGGNADAALNLINSQMANGMSFEQVQKGATATYRAMIASAEGAGQYDPESVAKLMKVLHDFGFQGEELATAFEHAMKSGMQGNFEIADMVTELPALLPAAKNSGLNGIQGFDYLLSILQSASNKSGSNSEAANNVRNLLEKTLSADTVRRLSRIDNPNDPSKGIDWANSVLQGKANGENAVQVLSRLANTMLERDQQYQQLKAKADAGDQTAAEQMNIMRGFVLSRILPDIQAKAGLLAASDVQQVQEYIQGLAGIDPKTNSLVDRKIGVMSRDDMFRQEQNRSLALLGRKDALDTLNSAETKWTEATTRYPKATLAAQAAGGAGLGAGLLSLFRSGGSGWAGNLLSKAGGGALGFGRGALSWGTGVLTAAPRFNFATGLLLHSPKLNAGEGSALERMRQLNQQYHGQALPRSALINYSDASRSTNQSPLNSPELQKSAEQIQQSSQTYQQSSEQYAQAVNHNQQAAAQFLEASRLMGTAAGQLAAAARQPVPVTVSVSGGNITAAVSQAAERDNRRN